MNSIQQFFHNILMARKMRNLAYKNVYTTTNSDGTLDAIAAKRKEIIEQQEKQNAAIRSSLENSFEKKQYLDSSSADAINKIRQRASDNRHARPIVEETIEETTPAEEKKPSFAYDFFMTVGMDLAGVYKKASGSGNKIREHRRIAAINAEKVALFNELAVGKR